MTGTRIHLDNASTSAPKSGVLWPAVRDIGAEPGCGGTRLFCRAHDEVEDARRTGARLLGVERSGHVGPHPYVGRASARVGIERRSWPLRPDERA